MAVVRRCVAWLDRRRALILALVASWVLLVAASAGRSADEDTWLGLPDTDFLVYVFMGFVLVNAVLFIVALALLRGAGGPPAVRRRRVPWPLVVLLMLSLAMALGRGGELGSGEQEAAGVPPAPETGQEGPAPIERPGAGFGEFAVLVAMVVASVAVLVWNTRRSPEPAVEDEDPDAQLEAALRPAFARAERQLRDESDPRTAVMLAYAGLEQTLTDAGCPRADHETPGEHLQRALARLRIETGPLMDLAGLYQLARFSERPIMAVDQQRAADALRQVQAGMAAPA